MSTRHPSSRPGPPGALAAVALASFLIVGASAGERGRADQAPEFPSKDPKVWIGPPQTLKALAGKVVILDVWTFG